MSIAPCEWHNTQVEQLPRLLVIQSASLAVEDFDRDPLLEERRQQPRPIAQQPVLLSKRMRRQADAALRVDFVDHRICFRGDDWLSKKKTNQVRPVGQSP